MLYKYLNSFAQRRIRGVFGNLQFSENIMRKSEKETTAAESNVKKKAKWK